MEVIFTSSFITKLHILRKSKQGDFWIFNFFYELYLTLLHLPRVRFHYVGGCWDRAQDFCDFGIIAVRLG